MDEEGEDDESSDEMSITGELNLMSSTSLLSEEESETPLDGIACNNSDSFPSLTARLAPTPPDTNSVKGHYKASAPQDYQGSSDDGSQRSFIVR